MPTYEYQPPQGSLQYTTFDNKSILANQSFELYRYLSDYVCQLEHFVFVRDEPYITPAIISATGSSNLEVIVPDCGHLIDVTIHTGKDSIVKVQLNKNTDPDHEITVFGTTTILRAINTKFLRVINTIATSQHCISCTMTTQLNSFTNSY